MKLRPENLSGGCRRTRAALPLLLSDDLSPAADRVAREHLASCPACQRDLRRWLDARAAWVEATGPRRPIAGVPAPDAEFFAALARDVHARVAAEARPIRNPRQPLRIAAAALLMLGLGVLGWSRPWVRPPAEPALDVLLAAPPLRNSRPFVFDPRGSTRPVAETFVGLRGRQHVDRAVQDALAGAIETVLPGRTVPTPR